MKRFVFILIMALATVTIVTAGSGAGLFSLAQTKTANTETEGSMAYCTITDLNAAYGEDRITAWSRTDPDTTDRAISDAGAEIDGYLLSGGYAVPLAGMPSTIKKYCIDIACANLVISAGMLQNDPGGEAVVEQAKIARRYLEKVAEGKFKIPGYSAGDETPQGLPSGNVQVSSSRRLDLRGY